MAIQDGAVRTETEKGTGNAQDGALRTEAEKEVVAAFLLLIEPPRLSGDGLSL